MVPKLMVTVVPSKFADGLALTNVVWGGKRSDSKTLSAGSGPPFVTTIWYVICPPGMAVSLSVDFKTEISDRF